VFGKHPRGLVFSRLRSEHTCQCSPGVHQG
jgi:hypothetical protein